MVMMYFIVHYLLCWLLMYVCLCLTLQAVNKLAEIMNRKDMAPNKAGKKVHASELRKKEKEFRKLQQEFAQVRWASLS